MRISDWTSDVCSSDLCGAANVGREGLAEDLRIMITVGEIFAPDAQAVSPVGRFPADRCIDQSLGAVTQPIVDLGEAPGIIVDVTGEADVDRKSVVKGKRVYVRVDLGGGRTIKK